MAKDSFLLYTEQKEVVDKLSDEQAGKIFKAIYEYVQTNQMPKLDGLLDIVIIPFKQNLDRNLEKWEETKKQRSVAGKKGAEAKKQNQANQANANFAKQNQANQANANFAKQNQANQAVNVNDNVNVNVNVNDNVNVNGLYLTLFNKYKKQIEEQPNRVVQIMSKMKESSDYELLTLEEQDQIFYDLMNPEKRSE